jgi:hypothetical protein
VYILFLLKMGHMYIPHKYAIEYKRYNFKDFFSRSPWEGHLIIFSSLDLTFFVYKIVKMIIPILLLSYCEDQIG